MLTFDANILFYAVDHQYPEKSSACRRLIDAAASQRAAFLTVQALGEFCHASARKRLLPRGVAVGFARDWAAIFDLYGADGAALGAALDYWAAERLSYWDAVLVATVDKARGSALISEDLHDSAVFGGVEIVNPFAPDAARRLAAHGLLLAD